MYRQMHPADLAEMEEAGRTTVTVKDGWENMNSWSSIPAFINYWIGTEHERVFTCYYTLQGNTIQVSNIEATDLIKDNKTLIDGYLFIALKGLMAWAAGLGMRRLVIDSYIPAIVDHMLDLGFTISSKGTQPGGTGAIRI